MADLGSTLKGIWMKGMEAIGNTASNIANNTKSKVDEMNLVNRRAEILKDFGNRAYALWQKGERFPEEMENQLRELEKLDEQLNDLRADRLTVVNAASDLKENKPEEETAPEETENAETEETPETETEETPETETEEAPETDESVEEAEDESVSEETPEEENRTEPVPVIRVEQPPKAEEGAAGVNDAINDLFEKVPSVEEASEKVNEALDSLEDGLKEISGKVDQTLKDLTEKITGDKGSGSEE